MSTKPTDHLTDIFRAAVERVDPEDMLTRQVALIDDELSIETEDTHQRVNLSAFDEIVILGAGKAGAAMARAMERILGNRITRGLVVVKEGHGRRLNRVEVVEASHPVPDERGVAAATRIAKMASMSDKETLFINLISGGGSALLVAPRSCTIENDVVELTLEDIQNTTNVLLASGATIQEINAIRKHLSAIKGGQLAALMHPAHSFSLILSDVVGDRLDAIASGITVPDPTTYQDALSYIECYGIAGELPRAVMRILTAGAEGLLPETPKPGDPVFRPVHNILLGTNHQALIAASLRAQELGYETIIITTQLVGEARVAGQFVTAVARDVLAHDLPVTAPACLLFGGETTVTIRGDGLGGRNQELALSVLAEMERAPELSKGIYILSGATDGTDGPTDAAGAVASLPILETAIRKGQNVRASLSANDSYNFFKAARGLVKTGPTRTNVCDIQIALICKE